MSLSTGSTKLKSSFKKLKQIFEETESEWNDSTRKQFEEDVLSLLKDQVMNALQGIDKLAEVIDRAERDCN